MNKEIITIFDSLGTVQGYKGAEPAKHKEFYLGKVAEEHNMQVEEMLKHVPAETYLQWTAEMIHNRQLTPTILPGAGKLIQSYRDNGIRPVIVTADIPEAAMLTSDPLVKAGLINKEDVYAILDLGSKKESSTWKKAKGLYFPSGLVKSVYEDTPANLDGAIQAYSGNTNFAGYLVNEDRNGIVYNRRN